MRTCQYYNRAPIQLLVNVDETWKASGSTEVGRWMGKGGSGWEGMGWDGMGWGLTLVTLVRDCSISVHKCGVSHVE